MIKSVLKRGVGAIKHRARKVVHRVRLARVKHISEFGWTRESAREFRLAGPRLCLETDGSDWGYQVRSQSFKVPQGCWAVLTLRGKLVKGAVSVGLLDATGSNWLDNHVLPAGRISERFLVNPKHSSATTIVFSNAQGGESVLELDDMSLAWMPEYLAREVGGTEASICAEIRDVIASAQPYAFDTGVGVPAPNNRIDGTGVYLRTDYWVKIKAGGSYGHTCYVAKELTRSTRRLVCFMANRFELLDDMGIEQVVMDGPSSTCNEIDVLRASRFYYDWLRDRIAELQPKYIYERAILGSYVGARLSRELGIPYILEYNGSEVSMKRSFDDRGYELEEAFTLAERAAFAQATTIVAISEVVAEGLINQGIAADKILVNPNGCSPDHYQPLTLEDKRKQRTELGWNDEHCVVGFIGTFGGWHGIDVLAESLAAICERDRNIRFLLIGDGNYRHLVDDAVKSHGLGDRVRMTGTIPQVPAAKLLACSDILVSPHSRHMIDSRFFGSPTKLFEYMSLGGAIVASRLEQIGAVLSPSLSSAGLADVPIQEVVDKLAVLCKPGDVGEFVDAVVGLAARPDIRTLLGRNARQVLIDNYTWERHVEKIWEHVDARSAAMKK
jgi:glycosyltransferase involved in cell wall biosynthesis